MTQLALTQTGVIQSTTCTLIEDSDYHLHKTGETTLNVNFANVREKEFINKFNDCDCGTDCDCAE